jgi:hypothetical protein
MPTVPSPPVNVDVLFAARVVNAPVPRVVAPMVVPFMVPPVIVTDEASWVDIVPKPVMSVFGMLATAVNALVPLPLT